MEGLGIPASKEATAPFMKPMRKGTKSCAECKFRSKKQHLLKITAMLREIRGGPGLEELALTIIRP
jgi:hypothetical protein